MQAGKRIYSWVHGIKSGQLDRQRTMRQDLEMEEKPEKGGMSARVRSWRPNWSQAKPWGVVIQGLLGRWASQSLYFITTRDRSRQYLLTLLLTLQFRSDVGDYHVCFYSLDHNCFETLACIKIHHIKDPKCWFLGSMSTTCSHNNYSKESQWRYYYTETYG